MKRLDTGRFDLAWGGIASLSVALSVVWTDASQRGFPLGDIARWMSARPAALAGLGNRIGSIEAGRQANFVVFDPEAGYVVSAEKLHYRHAISPYMDERLRGVVQATYLRGEAVFRDGTFNSSPRGCELTLC